MIIPDNLLQNKKILLGVTGSIAVYKSLELTRLFVKAGAEVKVVMSESAKKFVTPLTFETLSSNKVLDDTNESWTNAHNHIASTEWADIFLIAPCTTNTLAKLAHGIADTILLQCALASTRTKILSPSANTHMLANPITQQNLQILENANYSFVQTQVKELACKTVGDGAMAEPLEIFWQTARSLLQEPFYMDRDVVVTGGGTQEKIDDVRYISNYSSGKMASALASALYCKGANVSLIASKSETNLALGILLHSVQSAREMQAQLEDTCSKLDTKKKPYLFMAAAVSDYTPATPTTGKLKKEILGDSYELCLTKGVDILQSLCKEGLVSIGFKAEMDVENAFTHASSMLNKKNLNAVCLNVLKDTSSFGTDTNQIDFITAKGRETLPTLDKLSLSFEILKHAKKLS